MSKRKTRTRSLPLEIVDEVSILGPTGSSPYFRLTWVQPDGSRGTTTAGRDIEEARTKARGIAATIHRAAGPTGGTPIVEVIAEYVSTPIGRKQGPDGGDWTDTYQTQVRRALNRCATALRDGQPCWDIDRGLADTMRAQAGTSRVVTENTRALRGFLRWGHEEGYFSAEQAELLPRNAAKVKAARKGTAAPVRRRKGRRVEESETYIRDEDAPSAAQVVRLGEELAKAFPAWGRLAPEFAAGCGLRWGEQFQLTAYDCHLDEADFRRAGRQRPFIAVNWQISGAARVKTGDNRRKLPKGEKTRSTGVPVVSFTGYPLLASLKVRREEALREQREGRNPEALMFPTKTGKMFHHTSFNTKYLVRAAVRCEYADWPTRTWTETYTKVNLQTGKSSVETRLRTQMVLTWHSLRHRFARICVDILDMKPAQLMAIGGWEDETVVKRRYYESGTEHVDSGLAAFDIMTIQSRPSAS